MQPTPVRLSRAIWTAFRAAKPAHQSPTYQRIHYQQHRSPLRSTLGHVPKWGTQIGNRARFYSSDKQSRDIEKKVEDVKDRIDESLDSKAKAVADAEPALEHPRHETIVHTLPESSSIVHTKDKETTTSYKADANSTASDSSITSPPDMPSQVAQFRSNLSYRFSHFMDNLQSQIFVASRRINDLTGYTGIERLKREIETQEATVQSTRQLVKSTRSRYSEAIAMRSATQREVNDLLHRKHAWSAQDLERFTSLYRSDHANEQAEQKAHQALSEAEMQYEEASTKLAKGILARYHEEQIWSDKIRQMSTWGTWGLMGLNVLLFVLLQLAIEPWRRRRLVRGFEEKVEAALAAREHDNEVLREVLRTRPGNDIIQDAVAFKSENSVAVAGEQLAESIVDAITGSTDETTAGQLPEVATKNDIEAAAEKLTTRELQSESATAQEIVQIAQSVPEGGSPDVLPGTEVTSNSDSSTTIAADTSSHAPPIFKSTWSQLPSSIYASISNTYACYSRTLSNQFSKTDHVVLSHQELTTRILEGVATGAALAGGILFVIIRTR